MTLAPDDPRIPEHLRARIPQEQLPPPPEAMIAPPGGSNEALIAFASALNAVQPVARTQVADTGRYQYRYADLADVLEECKRACQMFNLAITQNATVHEGMLAMNTMLIHSPSGQWLTFPPMMMKLPGDAQALGSALTYTRRYSLLTIFGIAPEDDDGAKASQRVAPEYGGWRSGAEERIRTELNKLTPEARKAITDAFRISFGMGLADLEVSKHGDALEFVLTCIREGVPQPEDEAAVEARAQEIVDQATERKAATDTVTRTQIPTTPEGEQRSAEFKAEMDRLAEQGVPGAIKTPAAEEKPADES